ncbi:MAG TPA: hypothetical protein PLJ60_02495 [Chryseolinea sp.]|mgnify:CR=1 FL=1|nr:hypothetical protein [Chryseolinea sp.]HPH46096.1 hypothetical protein [Chryseolinea sp.]HPM29181.1 hypothetical protein [Chryseolinea sp.]
MNSHIRQYLYGVIFLGVGIYYLIKQDWIDAPLFLIAGLAFVVNTLASEPRLFAYKKILAIIAWVLIICTGILFLYWLQFKFL